MLPLFGYNTIDMHLDFKDVKMFIKAFYDLWNISIEVFPLFYNLGIPLKKKSTSPFIFRT